MFSRLAMTREDIDVGGVRWSSSEVSELSTTSTLTVMAARVELVARIELGLSRQDAPSLSLGFRNKLPMQR